MNGHVWVAVTATLAILVALLVACQWMRTVRRHQFLAPAKTPTPTPPSTRDPDDDVLLIRRLFATWMKYVWGHGSEPNDVVAYARQDSEKRWHVFVISQAMPYASAYVTLPHEVCPLDPAHVSWHYQTHPDTTAYALINITPESYSATPLDLPQSFRAPAVAPRITFIPNGTSL